MRVAGRVDAAVEVRADSAKRLEDACRGGEKRRIEQRRDRRCRRQAHEGGHPPARVGQRIPWPSGSERPPGDGAGRQCGGQHDDRRFLGRDRQACGNARQRRPRRPPPVHAAPDGDHEREREAGEQGFLDEHPRVEDHRGRERQQPRTGGHRRPADAPPTAAITAGSSPSRTRPSRRAVCVRRGTRASPGPAAPPPAASGSRAWGRDDHARRSDTRRARAGAELDRLVRLVMVHRAHVEP
jgi:hypothetical protein